jgi:hypothetical protein
MGWTLKFFNEIKSIQFEHESILSNPNELALKVVKFNTSYVMLTMKLLSYFYKINIQNSLHIPWGDHFFNQIKKLCQ